MNKQSIVAGTGLEKTISELVKRIEIQDLPDNRIQINIDSVQFALLYQMLEGLGSMKDFRIAEKQGILNRVFKKVLSESPHYMKENLETLSFYNELTLELSQSSEIFDQLSQAVFTHVKKEGRD